MFLCNKFAFVSVSLVIYSQVALQSPVPESDETINSIYVGAGFEWFMDGSGTHFQGGNAGPSQEKPSPTVEETVPSTETAVESDTTISPFIAPSMCDKFTVYFVSDYSKAFEKVTARFQDYTHEECCQGAGDLVESFSFENGECTYYHYAPYDRSVVGSSTQSEENPKALYIFTSDEKSCHVKALRAEDSDVEFRNGYTGGLSNGSHCITHECITDDGVIAVHVDDLYSMIGDRCYAVNWFPQVSFYSANDWNEATKSFILEFGDGPFNSWTNDMDAEFEELVIDHTEDQFAMNIVLDANSNAYKWRQSGREFSKNSLKWISGYPSNEQQQCLIYAVQQHGMADNKCTETFLEYHMMGLSH